MDDDEVADALLEAGRVPALVDALEVILACWSFQLKVMESNGWTVDWKVIERYRPLVEPPK